MKSSVRVLRSSAVVRTVLGGALSCLFLYLALRNVAYIEIMRALSQADVRLISLALLSVATNTIAKAVRWRILMGPAGRRLNLSKVLRALVVGQMLNLLIPLRIGDATRAYVIGSSGPGSVFTFGTVVLEKLLDMLAYAVLFATLLLLVPLPDWLTYAAYTVFATAVLVVPVLTLMVYRRSRSSALLERGAERLPGQIGVKLARIVRSGLSSLEVLRSRGDLAKLVGWSALVWGTAILNNSLILDALHLRLPLAAPLLVLIVLQAGISIPSAPGGVGVFEYLCVLSLAVFDVDQGTALSYGVLLHSVVMIPPILAGLLLFWRLEPHKAEPKLPGPAV